MEKSDLPLRFSTTKASSGTRSASLNNPTAKTRPKYEPISIVLSMTVFCLYFFVLREESDVDKIFSMNPKSTYEILPNLEKDHLEAAILNYKMEGRDTKALEAKLQQVNKELGQ